MTIHSGEARAAVVASDESVRASLVLLLEIRGFASVGFIGPQELLNSSLADEAWIFLDYTLCGWATVAELRRRGWRGTGVFMTEGEEKPDLNRLDEATYILAKPFCSDKVLDILENVGLGS